MVSGYVLKKMAKIHCARGPKRCEICKEYAKELKYALLDISPSEHPEAARPVIGLEINGENVWLPFDVVAYFSSIEEANEYVEKKGIEISQYIDEE